jgi:hypothetical protein
MEQETFFWYKRAKYTIKLVDSSQKQDYNKFKVTHIINKIYPGGNKKCNPSFTIQVMFDHNFKKSIIDVRQTLGLWHYPNPIINEEWKADYIISSYDRDVWYNVEKFVYACMQYNLTDENDYSKLNELQNIIGKNWPRKKKIYKF